jgi:hypothetical protein
MPMQSQPRWDTPGWVHLPVLMAPGSREIASPGRACGGLGAGIGGRGETAGDVSGRPGGPWRALARGAGDGPDQNRGAGQGAERGDDLRLPLVEHLGALPRGDEVLDLAGERLDRGGGIGGHRGHLTDAPNGGRSVKYGPTPLTKVGHWDKPLCRSDFLTFKSGTPDFACPTLEITKTLVPQRFVPLSHFCRGGWRSFTRRCGFFTHRDSVRTVPRSRSAGSPTVALRRIAGAAAPRTC